MTFFSNFEFAVKKLLFLTVCCPLLLLLATSARAQTYTSDPNIADFTSLVSTYATFTNYSTNQGCTASPFTPTSAELATTGCRVYNGTLTGTGLSAGNNWIEATFPSPVSTIIVFPNIDHYGSAYDGYQYTIAGSNDGVNWTVLFDALTVNGDGEPFTLGTFTGTAPTTINNVLTPQSTGIDPGCTGTSTPCAVGYIAQFTFSTAYQYYAFGASTEAFTAGNTDQELSAVGTTSTVTQSIPPNSETPPDLVAVFNSTPGQVIQTETKYVTSTANLTFPLNVPDLTSITTNTPLSQMNDWPSYAGLTPLYGSQCAINLGNGGADLCSLLVHGCYSAAAGASTATDLNCPYIVEPDDNNYVLLTNTFDWGTGGLPQVAPQTTFSLIDFTPSVMGEVWTPGTINSSVCTQVAPVANPATNAQCDLADTLVDVTGDQTTTRGSKPKASTHISVYNVPMLTSQPRVYPNPANAACPLKSPVNLNPAGWYNGACLLGFLVTPATVLAPDHINNLAAPPASLVYGVGSPVVQPGPIPGAQPTLTNSNAFCTTVGPCNPSSWDTGGVVALEPLFAEGGGQTLFRKSTDTFGISEKNIQLLPSPGGMCPTLTGSESAPLCYFTNYFTTTVSTDSVAPTASCVISPSSTINGWHKSDVLASCTGADNLSGIGTATPALAGVPTIGSTPVPFALQTTVGSSNFSATAYTGSEKLCDLANNCFTEGPLGPYSIDEVAPGTPTVTFVWGGKNYPNGSSFPAGQSVSVFYSCTDVGSGVSNCAGSAYACPAAPSIGSLSVSTTSTAVSTATAGIQNLPAVSATDCAGNGSLSVTPTYTVTAASADVALFEQETTDTPKHGTTLNYIVWALDLTKGASASNVVINFTIPAGIAGAGAVTGKVADVTCNFLTGCSSMPPSGGSACSVSPDNTKVSCNVGTLASVFNLTGSMAKISIPIAAPTGTKFNISATVTSANDPNPKNNTTTDCITVK